MRRSWAEISLTRLEHNHAVISRLVGGRPIIAVVKADAYGHGIEAVAPRLVACGVRTFGVADLGEARLLRRHAEDAEIIVFGGCDEVDAPEFRALRLTASLYREDRIPEGLPLEIKIETGMGRLGIRPERLRPLLEQLEGRVSGVYSTLPCADCDLEFTREQIARFREATDGLSVRRHLANSAALSIPEARFDAVRPGLALYGIANCPALSGLKPLLCWKSAVMAVNEHPPGAPIGYGASYRTSRASRIGILGIGYADGYRRALSNRGQVLTEAGPAPVVGRISMDLTAIDLTDLPSVGPGSQVVLLDSEPDSPVSAAALAESLGTIPYEILTTIGSRVERVYGTAWD